MSSTDQPDSRAQSLAFFGSITASVTHEIMNVIAIINELTGLLDDMRYSADQGQVIESERLESLHERFSKQVSRGEKIIKRLNKFAHSADYDLIEFDLNETFRNLIGLMQRLADMKRINLSFEPSPAELRCTASPFELQHLIFRCGRMLLNSGEEGATVSLGVQKQADCYSINVTCSDIPDQGPERDELELVTELAAAQGWNLQSRKEDSKFLFILTMPVRQTKDGDC
ncbi:MAG TPA: HAMP domain-containing histidine kinase [candidate division Zixibacteria bacterium]|nr:HAMP domain-containing histidine kinase [candidate division Zixibacteria bacterium]HEQ98254.1 HAMP domain-containing histidine kinase [candidate division Zixibacteria bacterium]